MLFGYYVRNGKKLNMFRLGNKFISVDICVVLLGLNCRMVWMMVVLNFKIIWKVFVGRCCVF